jgi:ABC-2 type transport system permease protein
MKRLWNLYFQLIGIQVRSQMQYRFSFLMELLSTGILNGVYFLSLVLIFERFKSVAGWTLGEVAFLAGSIEMSFAMMDMIFSGFDPDAFSTVVRTGSLDQMLLRPVPITLQVFGSRFQLRRIGRFLEGAVILCVALSLSPVQWTAAKLAYFPVVFLSQVLAFGALFIMGSTLTFWTVQPVEAVNILTYGGNELMTYPVTIYPAWLQRFFTYVIPFVFLNYYPALFFLDKPDPLGFTPAAPFLAPLAGLVMLAAALAFWRFGLNHYQSTGS